MKKQIQQKAEELFSKALAKGFQLIPARHLKGAAVKEYIAAKERAEERRRAKLDSE